jgi:ketosteroid isomerase-like protein
LKLTIVAVVTAALVTSCSADPAKPNCSDLRDARSVGPGDAAQDAQAAARPVAAFYAAFNADFECNVDFATADWTHINPFGHLTSGEQVVQHLRDVHSTFLKGVRETVEQMQFRWVDGEVALVTVTSKVSPYQLPAGVMHENERQRRTFVVVHRDAGWLVMLDHNTIVVGDHDGGRPVAGESATEPPDGGANSPTTEEARRQGAVDAAGAFYSAFERHSFENASDFASEDWAFIDSSGAWTGGREAVVALQDEQHASYFAAVSNTIEDEVVRFADDTVATVSITSRLSDYTTPDGVDHENERQLSTFVVTERNDHWYSVHTQQTVVGE